MVPFYDVGTQKIKTQINVAKNISEKEIIHDL